MINSLRPAKLIIFATLQQVTQMPDELHMMDIKQEPVEWSDFEHDNPTLSKSIEVTVKPEMIYAKTNADDDGMWQFFAFLCFPARKT